MHLLRSKYPLRRVKLIVPAYENNALFANGSIAIKARLSGLFDHPIDE